MTIPEAADAAIVSTEDRELNPALRKLFDRCFGEPLIDHFAEHDPPPFEWLVERLLPANVVAQLNAPGGTGKGLLEVLLGIHLALGADFHGFKVPKPVGVVLVTFEDTAQDMHRRVNAALDHHFPGWKTHRATRKALRERLFVVPVAGVQGAALTDAFIDSLIERTSGKRAGLVVLDPLMRMANLPAGTALNSQEGGGATINQLDRISKGSGATVLYAHHTNKAAEERSEASVTDSTGTKMLTDLARFVVSLRLVRNPAAVGLPDPQDHEYLVLTVVKANGPKHRGPAYFDLCEGFLDFAHASGSPETAEDALLDFIVEAGEEGRTIEAQELRFHGVATNRDGEEISRDPDYDRSRYIAVNTLRKARSGLTQKGVIHFELVNRRRVYFAVPDAHSVLAAARLARGGQEEEGEPAPL